MSRPLTRREFLKVMGVTLGLAACRQTAPLLVPPTPTNPAGPTAGASPTVSPLSPTPPPTRTPTATPQPLPPLEMQIGQLLMVGFRGLRVKPEDPIAQAIAAGYVGGVVLFDVDGPSGGQLPRNVASPEQVQALIAEVQALAPTPLLVAVDYEGGNVARLRPRYGFPETLSPWALGQQGVEATRTQAQAMARLLRELGFNLNLAPVADVCTNPDNPIIARKERCFAADAETVTAHARAFVEAHHAVGVACTLKHFPGHGSSSGDTHQGWVDVTTTWRAEELQPYQVLIAEGLADAVMTAHVFNAVLDGQDPATLSAPTIEGVLRQELGFRGVVISDDLQMRAITRHYTLEEAVRKALLAGVDVLALANNSAEAYDERLAERLVTVIQHLVDEGKVPATRIAEAYRRVTALKQQVISEEKRQDGKSSTRPMVKAS